MGKQRILVTGIRLGHVADIMKTFWFDVPYIAENGIVSYTDCVKRLPRIKRYRYMQVLFKLIPDIKTNKPPLLKLKLCTNKE